MARRATQPTASYVSLHLDGDRSGAGHGVGAAHGRAAGTRRYLDYPREGKHGVWRWMPSCKQVTAAALSGLLLVTLIFSFFSRTTVPAADASALAQTSIVYWSDGSEMGRLSALNRRNITAVELTPQIRNAVMAAEDRTFYTNKGVSLRALVRAAWSNANGGQSLQGGSTITQQYVKNVILNERDRTMKRKVKEMFIALKVARTQSKDQILLRYVNSIYFGRDAYGIEAASLAYFHKHANKLNYSQAAYLGGVINSPENTDYRDGGDGKARALRRWNNVLDGMVEMGAISAVDRAKFVKFPYVYPEAKPEDSFGGAKGYLMTMAKKEAATVLRKPEKEVTTGGYKIYTTFDKKQVNLLYASVKAKLPANHPSGVRVGAASLDPRTGAVLAVYGGRNYLKSPFNQATQATAMAGSTFKPFGLLAALEDGKSLYETYDGNSPKVIEGKTVNNFGNEQMGSACNLIRATAHSVNTVYVALNADIGPQKTRRAALRAGLPQSAHIQDNLVNVLGSADPHPIDMASAYGTIAAQGVRHPWFSVKKITTVGTGDLRYSGPDTTGEQVFKKDHVADATYAMQQVVRQGTATKAASLYYRHPIAGKTGTSQDSRSAWFVGFTPRRVTAVALYQQNRAGHQVAMKGFGGYRSIAGATIPLDIWLQYMNQATAADPVEQFPQPTFGGDVTRPAPVVTTPPAQPTERPTGQPTTPPPSTPPNSPSFPGNTTPPVTRSRILPTGPFGVGP